MREFKTYLEARSFAERMARQTLSAWGIEKPTPFCKYWTVKGLPRPENRAGYELRIEAVEAGGDLAYAREAQLGAIQGSDGYWRASFIDGDCPSPYGAPRDTEAEAKADVERLARMGR